MGEMINPYHALQSYQEAYRDGRISPDACKRHPELAVLFDNETGSTRITYARIDEHVAKAIVIYIFMDEFINGLPCFELGYAVDPGHRDAGLATDTLRKSIEEMRAGFAQHGKAFWIRAVIGEDNAPSHMVAAHVLAVDPTPITDGVSGLPAFEYLRLVQCAHG